MPVHKCTVNKWPLNRRDDSFIGNPDSGILLVIYEEGPGFDLIPAVRITYNEGCNVIMTVTGSASQLRGSELFKIGSCFLGTGQWI